MSKDFFAKLLLKRDVENFKNTEKFRASKCHLQKLYENSLAKKVLIYYLKQHYIFYTLRKEVDVKSTFLG